MKKTVKSLWIKALKSGKYKQGCGALHRGDRYCCLGVLCDLHRKKVLKKGTSVWESTTEPTYYSYCGLEDLILPKLVQEWAGLTVGNPEVTDGSLARYNDDGKSFDEIAELIKKDM